MFTKIKFKPFVVSQLVFKLETFYMVLEMNMKQFTEEQRLMWQTTHDLMNDVVIPWVKQNVNREWEMDPNKRLPIEMLKAIDEVGLRTIGIPEEYGGTILEPGTEAQTFALIIYELGRADLGLADMVGIGWKLCTYYRFYMAEHLQKYWFPKIVADPTFLLAQAVTEQQGTSDRWLPYEVPESQLKTTAVKDGDYWVINGYKIYITNGYDAQLFNVYAQTNFDNDLWEGAGCFLVPADTPGVSVARCDETLGGRFSNNGEIRFDNVRVPEDHVLLKEGALGKADEVYYRPGKVMLAAKNLGIGIAAFEDTVTWCHDRVQGGVPLIEHQAVAVRLADMATRLEAVRSFTFRVAREIDEEVPGDHERAIMLKSFVADQIIEVCRHSIELFGGSGTMLELPIQKYLRDAFMFPHMDGATDICSFRIIKALFPDTAGTYAKDLQ